MNSVSYEKVPYHLCFDTLANELRIGIIRELEAGPKSVSQLSKALNAEQSTVSHSLGVLKTCSFVKAEVKGKERQYSLMEDFKFEGNESSIFKALEEHAHSMCNDECKKITVGGIKR
ncbi:MAG: metalloregulator ArsR/SmtB family transcription factor [archaeon]|nr:metalloregulator ArsR/SmtB family transcription factor [archaeon]